MAEETRILTELGDQLFLQANFKNEGKSFALTVLDGENIWEGTISENYLDQQCKDLKMDFNTYIDQTRAAFTDANVAEKNFECHFKITSATSAQLIWKKMPRHDIKYNLGSVTLKKCSNSARKICDVLSHNIADSQVLQAEIQSLKRDNERLSFERKNALKRLDKCVTAKEELELDLYSKFLQVLNSKKERIQLLQENSPVDVLAMSKEKDTPSPTLQGYAARKHKLDSVLENSDVDTDEEEYKKSDLQQSGKSSTSGKVKKMESSLAETSLNLEEEDYDTQTRISIARRPHRQAIGKKCTPTRPTLPRISSCNYKERSGSAGRKSSLRKSASNNSNKSSDILDPEDLLDRF